MNMEAQPKPGRPVPSKRKGSPKSPTAEKDEQEENGDSSLYRKKERNTPQNKSTKPGGMKLIDINTQALRKVKLKTRAVDVFETDNSNKSEDNAGIYQKPKLKPTGNKLITDLKTPNKDTPPPASTENGSQLKENTEQKSSNPKTNHQNGDDRSTANTSRAGNDKVQLRPPPPLPVSNGGGIDGNNGTAEYDDEYTELPDANQQIKGHMRPPPPLPVSNGGEPDRNGTMEENDEYLELPDTQEHTQKDFKKLPPPIPEPESHAVQDTDEFETEYSELPDIEVGSNTSDPQFYRPPPPIPVKEDSDTETGRTTTPPPPPRGPPPPVPPLNKPSGTDSHTAPLLESDTEYSELPDSAPVDGKMDEENSRNNIETNGKHSQSNTSELNGCLCQEQSTEQDQVEGCNQTNNIISDNMGTNEQHKDSPSMEDHKWYYSDITRNDADTKVKESKTNGRFLVRRSYKGGKSNPYTLCLNFEGTVKNLHIRLRDDKKYAIGIEKPGELTFDSVPDMISYHHKNFIIISDSSEQGGGTVLLSEHV